MAERKKLGKLNLTTKVVVRNARRGGAFGAMGRFTKRERVIFITPAALRFMNRRDQVAVEA
ncbi:hypothetical protein KKC88_00565 [Patescibacteria group bacterium]|nr:hypothetical protein [Patescibacteria group bacterium]MBU1673298.1 hypothetical protein [Patescibacteria group bacterium]MBU1963208.1 hypothetical protein [Patescibacteria group bacterium]